MVSLRWRNLLGIVISNDVCHIALLKNTKGSQSMRVMKISIEMTTILDHSGVVSGK